MDGLGRISLTIPTAEPSTSPSRAPGAKGFADELGKALDSVEKLQVASDQQADALAHGSGNLHEASIALEKADISLRLATKVRNRLVEAYQEIMRMQV